MLYYTQNRGCCRGMNARLRSLAVNCGWPPRAVALAWLAHLAISLGFGLALQANPELPEAPWFFAPDWASNLAHWDVQWEVIIAEQGYGPDFQPQTSAKFPLLALTARLLAQVSGLSLPAALFALNKLGTLAGLWAVWALANDLYDRTMADRTVGYLAFPLTGTAYVYWMSYPEPLFLAQWALAFLFVVRRQEARAGLMAVLAVWTRPQGALLVAALGLDVLAGERRLSARLGRRALIVCLPPALALAAWLAHISALTGIPFSPYAAQAESGRALAWPWERVLRRAAWMVENPGAIWPGHWLEAWQLLLIALGLAALLVLWRRGRVPGALAAFTLLGVALPLATRILAIGRFSALTWLPVVPALVIPARWRALDWALWALGAGLALWALVGINTAPLATLYVP